MILLYSPPTQHHSFSVPTRVRFATSNMKETTTFGPTSKLYTVLQIFRTFQNLITGGYIMELLFSPELKSPELLTYVMYLFRYISPIVGAVPGFLIVRLKQLIRRQNLLFQNDLSRPSTIKRLSTTFTANGKNETSAECTVK